MFQRGKARRPPVLAKDPNVLDRNNTSFPARSTVKLRALYSVYLAAQSDTGNPEHRWANILKYYQYLVRAVMSDPEYGIGADGNARGLLLYAGTGLGKTRAAAAVMMALWDLRPIVVMLPRGLQKNFRDTVIAVISMLNPELAADAAAGDAAAVDKLARLQAAAVGKLSYVSMDAYNSADQMARAGTGTKRRDMAGAVGGLDGKLLIVDEAHNFFRAIINSSAENANARRMYDMIMGARDLRLLFLTGTPAGKDPFELVPCFNMLAGKPLLPVQYEQFYSMYVDKGAHAVRNRGPLANRLVGLVSHVGHDRPTQPCAAAAPRRGPLTAGAHTYAWRVYTLDELLAAPADVRDAVTELIRLYRREGPHGPGHLPSLESLRDEFAGRNQYVLVVTAGSEPGAAGGSKTPSEVAMIGRADADIDASITGTANLSMIYTAEAHRRRGLCAAALEYLMAAAGAAAYTLEVHADNEAAIGCYKKRGFIWNDAAGEAEPSHSTTTAHQLRSMVWRSGAAKVPRDDGWFPEERPTIVERVEMGDDQYRQYLLAREKEELEGKGGEGGRAPTSTPALALPGSEKKAMKSYFVHSRMLSLFAPAREYVKMSIDDMPDAAFSAEAGPKLALIADRIVAAPGPVLVYSQFVERGGLKPLGRYLQARGFRQYVPVLAPRKAAPRAGRAPLEITDEAKPAAVDGLVPPLLGGGILQTQGGGTLPSGVPPAKALVDARRGAVRGGDSVTYTLRAADASGDTFTIGGRVYDLATVRTAMHDAPVDEVPTEQVLWELGEGADRANASQEVLGPTSDCVADNTPILVTANGVVVDGVHRLACWIREGRPTVRIRHVPPVVLEAAFLFGTTTLASGPLKEGSIQQTESSTHVTGGDNTFTADGREYRTYDTAKLRAAMRDAPVEKVATEKLTRALDLPWWGRLGSETSARDVLANPLAYPEHIKRVVSADLERPLLVIDEGLRDLTLVDGIHRLMRAVRDGLPSVRVKRIPPAVLEANLLFAEDEKGDRLADPPKLVRANTYRTRQFSREELLAAPEEFRERVADLIRGYWVAIKGPSERPLEELLGDAPQRIVVIDNSCDIIAIARVELADGFVGLIRTSLLYQGQGFCKAAVRALMAAEPARAYWLQTNVDNPAAIACYKACGFVIDNPPDIGPNEVRMVRAALTPGPLKEGSVRETEPSTEVAGGSEATPLSHHGGRRITLKSAKKKVAARKDSAPNKETDRQLARRGLPPAEDYQLVQFTQDQLYGTPTEYQNRIADLLRDPDYPEDRTSTLRQFFGDAPQRIVVLTVPGEVLAVARVRLDDSRIHLAQTGAAKYRELPLCEMMTRAIMQAEPNREYMILVNPDDSGTVATFAACGFGIGETVRPGLVQMVRPGLKKGGAASEAEATLQVSTYTARGKELHVVRDDLLPAGTKQRAAPAFVRALLKDKPAVTTLMYTAPYNGYGPVAAAFAAKELGLKCVLILARKAFGAPRATPIAEVEEAPTVRAAVALGATVTITDTWADLVAAGAAYADRPDVCWLPLGFQDSGAAGSTFSRLLAEAIGAAAPAAMRPARIWVAGGTGALAVALAAAFPAAEIRVVPASLDAKVVGKLAAATAAWPRIHIETAHAPHELAAPYPTVPGYDERAWDSAVAHGESGDYVWNVAGHAQPAASKSRKTTRPRDAPELRAVTIIPHRARHRSKDRRHGAKPEASSRPADQAREADRAPAEDFPYRAAFMPPAAEMFARLRELALHPPPEWEGAKSSETLSNTDGKIAVVRRSYPEDYDATDSITDHFVERIRIGCRERGEDSPAAAWAKLRERADLPAGARERRELVYSAARGCNLFNAALAAYLVGRFGRGGRVLDCTAGWGDRLVAAHAGGAVEYRGWDTNPDLQPVYAAIAAAFGEDANLDWSITLAPFESAEDKFRPGGEYHGYFDMAFLCPPYFDKEVYQGPGTSTETNPTEEQWYSGFYRRAVRAAAGGLKPGGHLLAYVPPGRMYSETATILSELGLTNEGAVGFQQIVIGKRAIDRDTFVWRRRLDGGAIVWVNGGAASGDESASDDGSASETASDSDESTSRADAMSDVDWAALPDVARLGVEHEWAAHQLTLQLFGALPINMVLTRGGSRAFTEGRNAIERWLLASANEAPWPASAGAWALHRTLLAAPEAGAKLATELSAVGFDGARVAEDLVELVERAVRNEPARLSSMLVSVTDDGVRVEVDETVGGALEIAETAQEAFYVSFADARHGAALLARVRNLPAGEAACAVARMALRYAAAAAGGQQLGLPRAHYAALHAAGVRNEAFASPLNSRLLPFADTRFCSLFPDTDAPFGSAGRFFGPSASMGCGAEPCAEGSKILSETDLAALPGDWTVNPPYIEALMARTAARVLGMLNAGLPRRAFVLMPAWDDAAAVRALVDSPLAAHAEALTKGSYSLEEPGGRVFAAPFACYYVGLASPGADTADIAELCRAAHAVAGGGADDTDADADKPTYAIISGEVTEDARAAIMAACASPANAHGAIIKGILVSKTGAEGLDLKNIRETLQAESYWDAARDAQIRGRASRLGSHDALPRDERVVQPRIYLAVANKIIRDRALDKEAKTIDELFYDRAQDKYQTNVAFRQLLAEVCLECQLFGYGRCRVCVPTNVKLYHDDPALDLRLPDPCTIREESDVEATPITLGDRTYYYVPAEGTALGYTFYRYREDLGGYAVVDQSDPVISELVAALRV